MKDVVIIGMGPAGIQSAIYLKNYNLNCLVLGKDYGDLTKDDFITNFYSHEKISGFDLIDHGVKQAVKLGIPVKKDPVLSIINEGNHFIIKTENNIYQSKAVLLATGKVKAKMDVVGFNEFRGKGIHLCATCDGFFYRNKKVGIIGSGPYLKEELSILKRFINDITIFTNNHPFKLENEKIINEKIIGFDGSDRLNKITTTKNTYNIDGVFVALDFPVASELALKLGLVMEDDNIVVNDKMETNIKGVFAAGDCIGGNYQIVKTLNDGLLASIGIYNYLKDKL
ncbi:MAG: NAD(P)/FAD-dependent oxidoreductase [Acholeplasmataceae bacterium]